MRLYYTHRIGLLFAVFFIFSSPFLFAFQDEGDIYQGFVVWHEGVSPELHTRQNGFGGSASIWTKASPDAVFDLVSDWQNYPKFFSRVEECQVIEKTGNVEVVRFKVNAIFFSLSYYVRHVIDRSNHKISWSLDPHYHGSLQLNEGYLAIAPEGDHGGSRVVYALSADISHPLFLPGFVKRYYMKKEICRAMAELRSEAEKEVTK